MDDDFNTAKGIGILFNLIKETNRLLDEGGTEAERSTWPIWPPISFAWARS